MARVNVEMGQHVVLLGSTGSGKTQFFRRVIMPQTDRLLIIDTEGIDFPDIKRVKYKDGDSVGKAIPKYPGKFQWRWMPPATMEVKEVDRLANRMLHSKNCLCSMIYMDEVTDFSDAHKISPWTKALFRKARKRKITIVTASQKPAGFNKWIWSNSIHKFLFYTDPYERLYLDDLYKGMSESIDKIKWGSYRSIYIDQAGLPHLLTKAK